MRQSSSDRGVRLEWLKLLPEASRSDSLAVVTLDRADRRNAFDPPMIERLTEIFDEVSRRDEARALVLQGVGSFFCGGADLEWMRDSVGLSEDENRRDARLLQAMFEALVSIPVPSIALVKGGAFGGGVGLLAACDTVIAENGSRFCLSEARLGLVAAVISPYLSTRLSHAFMRRWALSARLVGAEDALSAGLLDRVVDASQMTHALTEELTLYCQGARQAQQETKTLYRALSREGFPADHRVVEAIARTRVASAGQEGLQAFLEKRPASWVVQPASDLAARVLALGLPTSEAKK
jgi:methylglutaconyl-CoA hydratase